MAHQYVWSQMYIDAMVLRDTYSGGAIQPDARIYTQFDANYNVTALIGYNASTNTWGVVQRYVYTPYGVATVLDANWNATADQFAWQYLHQGGRQDPITGLYDFRHRDYSPTLGNWIEQDPMGYVDGGSRYGYEAARPAAAPDSGGMRVAKFIAGRGRFQVSMQRDRGNVNGTNVHVYFWVAPSLLLPKAKCHCTKIMFVQFVKTTYRHGVYSLGNSWLHVGPGRWHLDDGYNRNNLYRPVLNLPGENRGPLESPFYGQQVPWLAGGKMKFGYDYDSPGPSGGSIFWDAGMKQEWKTYAVCVRGPEKDSSYGYTRFGIHYEFTGGRWVTRWVQNGGFGAGRPGSAASYYKSKKIAPLPGWVAL